MALLRSIGVAIAPFVRALTRRSSGIVRRGLVYVHRRLLGRAPVMIAQNGFNMLVTVWDNVGYNLYYRGEYEPEQTRVFNELLQRTKPGLFIDIGANFGYYSLTAIVAGVSKVWAFEPSPDIADALERNIRVNETIAARIRVERAAISDTDGTVTFWLNRYSTNFGTGSIA